VKGSESVTAEQDVRLQLTSIADNFAAKGWLFATSGNLSIRTEGESLRFGITASGRDKEQMTPQDIVFVDGECKVVDGADMRPSAETIIHAKLYKAVDCGSVLHVHTIYNNLVSHIHAASGYGRISNHAGGIEGGISNGQPIVVRAAMKPIPTLYKPLNSVDMETKEPYKASIERSDTCAVPAASVVGEAVVAWVLARSFCEKFGGDSLAQMQDNVSAYRERIQRR